MKKDQVLNCNFSTWYSTFKDVTIKSRILAIPVEFLTYLHEDGVILPEGSHGICSKSNTDWDSDDEEFQSDWGDDTKTAATSIPPFTQFTESVRKAIAALGGAVFPKLNWSSPKDATWITLNNSLRCECPADIYLLLKSSTFVSHDLDTPFDLCEDYETNGTADVKYELVLRRWHDIAPGYEFRCFVKGKKLIGISQRDTSSYYHFILKEDEDITEDIQTFHRQKIGHKFPDVDYVFDVFRKEKGKVYLLDFNPFGPVTDSLLFTWEELLSETPQTHDQVKGRPTFRYVQSGAGIQYSPYRSYGIPQDFVDLTTGMDADKLVDLLQLQKIQDEGEDAMTSSDDETHMAAKESQRFCTVQETDDDLGVHQGQAGNTKTDLQLCSKDNPKNSA